MGGSDTNGQPGAEFIINNVSSVKIIRDASRTTGNYSIAGYGTLNRIANIDGVAGDEVVLNAGSSTRTIYDASGIIR